MSLLRFKILKSVLFLRHYLLEFTLQELVSCNEMTKFKEIYALSLRWREVKMGECEITEG